LEALVTTRAALLLALRSGPGYGAELIERVAAMTNGRVRLRQGAVYPALRALEADGVLRSWMVAPPRPSGGRSRTYYELTLRGVAASLEQRETLTALLAGRGERPAPLRAGVSRLRQVARLSQSLAELRRRMQRPAGGGGR